MQQLAKFLKATGRRLRFLANGESVTFSARAKSVSKIAIKIPFFFEIEINCETDWNRRR